MQDVKILGDEHRWRVAVHDRIRVRKLITQSLESSLSVQKPGSGR
jgi:hypothetical protein